MQAFPDLAGNGVSFMLELPKLGSGSSLSLLFLNNAIVAAAQITLGMVLIVLAPMLARFFVRWWEFGK